MVRCCAGIVPLHETILGRDLGDILMFMGSIMPMQNMCTLLHMLSHGPRTFMDMSSREVLSGFQASCHRFESDLGLFAIFSIWSFSCCMLREFNQPLCKRKYTGSWHPLWETLPSESMGFHLQWVWGSSASQRFDKHIACCLKGGQPSISCVETGEPWRFSNV